jgi:hypothetical protein
MVQFNLLPDIKLEYVKTRRTKHLMAFVSIVVGAVAIAALLIALFVVDIVQKKSLSDLNNDISAYSKQLKNTKDLSSMLTVQNQLSTLTSLHDAKPVASRLFTFISQVTPAQANLNKLNVDYSTNTITIGGTAPTLDTVSLYTDTLKATKFTATKDAASAKAFMNVVLSSFGRDDKGATFTITLTFDPAIFVTSDKVELIVPSTAAANQAAVFGGGN